MYLFCELITYFAVNQEDFQSTITDLLPNCLEAKCQQDKAVFCQETRKIKAFAYIMFFDFSN